jgi:hypothetical protein
MKFSRYDKLIILNLLSNCTVRLFSQIMVMGEVTSRYSVASYKAVHFLETSALFYKTTQIYNLKDYIFSIYSNANNKTLSFDLDIREIPCLKV